MPEYSQIQTYLKCDRKNFKEIILHFSNVLKSLSLESKYFTTELEYEVSDNGFMYVGGDAESQIFDYNEHPFHIRPYVMGWTPKAISELEESWLEVSLLFWTEEIELDYRTGQLKDEIKSLVWSMLSKFSEEFKQTGVYFTNEVTDGIPWEAVVCSKKDEVWAFDAAILPAHLFDVYKDGYEEMFIYTNDNNTLYAARKSVWRIEPWLDDCKINEE